jgi:acyl CoA:acetate/3-ketoacid CoA transferase beta subunit
MVIADLGVLTIDPSAMTLTALAPGVSLEQIRAKTEAAFRTGPGIARRSSR